MGKQKILNMKKSEIQDSKLDLDVLDFTELSKVVGGIKDTDAAGDIGCSGFLNGWCKSPEKDKEGN